MGCELQASRPRVVKADRLMDGRQQPQISDSGWDEKAARAYTAACSDLDEQHWMQAITGRLGRPLMMHMGEGEGKTGWNGTPSFCKLENVVPLA